MKKLFILKKIKSLGCKLLFSSLIAAMVISCTESDDTVSTEPQSLQIKKLTNIGIQPDGNPNGDISEYLFAENGNLTQRKMVVSQFSDTRISDFTHNQLGQVIENKTTFVGTGNFKTLEYYYDAENRMDYVTESINNSEPETYYEFTYQPNEIKIDSRVPFVYDLLTYSNNKLTSHLRGSDGGSSTQLINYDANDNIAAITLNENNFFLKHEYEYDSKINPCYNYFKEHPFNLLDEYFYNLNLYRLFFSSNNITNYTYQNDEESFGLITVYQYNEAGYPISAITTRDNVIVSESTYEYY